MLRRIAFQFQANSTTSNIVDLGDDNEVIVGISIHGTWTAAKIGFQAYVPDSGFPQEVTFNPQTGQPSGGPYSAQALFDTVSDHTGTPIQWGNGTATSGQYLVIPEASQWRGARYIKVTSSATQAQPVTGYLLVKRG